MAEFPELGAHCGLPECHILDFLPMKCDACSAIMCRNHIDYDSHRCPSGERKGVQVPVCPLCSKPVPIRRGELPDAKVGEHIDRECRSDPAQKRRRNELQCSILACRKRELVRILCPNCKRNFCLTHRHTTEHGCMGTRDNPRLRKLINTPIPQYDNSSISITESDAELARALHAAMNGGAPPPKTATNTANADELSRQLALQLQAEEYRRQSAESGLTTRCAIS